LRTAQVGSNWLGIVQIAIQMFPGSAADVAHWRFYTFLVGMGHLGRVELSGHRGGTVSMKAVAAAGHLSHSPSTALGVVLPKSSYLHYPMGGLQVPQALMIGSSRFQRSHNVEFSTLLR